MERCELKVMVCSNACKGQTLQTVPLMLSLNFEKYPPCISILHHWSNSYYGGRASKVLKPAAEKLIDAMENNGVIKFQRFRKKGRYGFWEIRLTLPIFQNRNSYRERKPVLQWIEHRLEKWFVITS